MSVSGLQANPPTKLTDSNLNMVQVLTSLTPHELLAHLKQIEGAMGRDFNGERFGPRPIDLDILFYDHVELQTENLVIPHPRIKEREFVLRPLCEYVMSFARC